MWSNPYRRLGKRRQARSTNLIRQELIEAMQPPGCPVCKLAQRKSLRYIETLLETAIVDVDQRDDWREAGGFCQAHAEMALTLPNVASSLAILYEDVLQHELATLATLVSGSRFTWWPRRRRGLMRRVRQWLDARQKRGGCPICRTWQPQERLYWAVLLDCVEEDEVRRALSQSDGLCMPHTVSLLQYGAHHANLPTFLVTQRECFQRLYGDLTSFIRKQDYRFARETYGEEADAWQRAVACFVGGRGASR